MSNRITKDEARFLASKLVSVKIEGVGALRKAYEQKAFDLYNATVPKDVAACFKKHPTWFRTFTGADVDSFGFHREYISFPDDCEVVGHDNDSQLKLTKETASELISAKRAWEKERDRVEEIRNKIKHALTNLHTYKRIIEQFPDAEPFLPKKYSPPAINYSSLKPIVKELITNLKEKQTA